MVKHQKALNGPGGSIFFPKTPPNVYQTLGTLGLQEKTTRDSPIPLVNDLLEKAGWILHQR